MLGNFSISDVFSHNALSQLGPSLGVYRSKHGTPGIVDYFNGAARGGEGLAKGLTAGVDAQTRMALQFEDLDAEYTRLLWDKNMLLLWKLLPTTPATSHIYEYDRHTSYGTETYDAFSETGTPAEDEGTYEKLQKYLKIYGTQRRVSVVLEAVDTLEREASMIAEENMNGLMAEMSMREQYFWHECAVDQNGNTVDTFLTDGLMRQMAAFMDANTAAVGNRIDCGGSQLTLTNLIEAEERLYEYGYLADFTKVAFIGDQPTISGIHAANLTSHRYNIDNVPGPINYGAPIKGMTLNYGTIPLMASIFLNPPNSIKTVADAGAPDTPTVINCTVDATPTTVIGGATSFFSEASTTVYYSVSAATHGLESTALAGTGVTVPAGDAVNVVITPGATRGSKLRIYKSLDGVTYRWVDDIAAGTSGNITWIDNNLYPARKSCFIIPINDRLELEIAQLLPWLKFWLARTAITMPWALFSVLAIVLRNPRRFIWFADCG